MIYSKRKEFLFIHVPKTAGTSIRAVLEPYGGKSGLLNFMARQLENYPGLCNLSGLNAARTYDSHTTYRKISHILPAAVLDKAYTFAFVRHPFDRLYSFYLHTAERKQHVWNAKILGYGSFSNMIQHLNELQEPSQKSYLTDDAGTVKPDFIGRFENLEEDFQVVCERLDIPFNLPKKNARKHKNWKDAFTEEDRQVAYDFYKEDFDTFDYNPHEK